MATRHLNTLLTLEPPFVNLSLLSFRCQTWRVSPCPHFALNPESTLINEMPVPGSVSSLHHISQPSACRTGQEAALRRRALIGLNSLLGGLKFRFPPPRNGLVSFSCLSRPFHSRQRKVESVLWRVRQHCVHMPAPLSKDGSAHRETSLEIGASPRVQFPTSSSNPFFS